jgi:hypothetical protein
MQMPATSTRVIHYGSHMSQQFIMLPENAVDPGNPVTRKMSQIASCSARTCVFGPKHYAGEHSTVTRESST